MSAVDLDTLDKLRGADCPMPGCTPPPGGCCGRCPILRDLIAEARKYRALREAVAELANRLERESATVAELAGLPLDDFLHFWRDDAPARLRAVVATVDGEQ